MEFRPIKARFNPFHIFAKDIPRAVFRIVPDTSPIRDPPHALRGRFSFNVKDRPPLQPMLPRLQSKSPESSAYPRSPDPEALPLCQLWSFGS